MSEKSARNEPLTAKPRLCVDIDNVIAQTDEVMRRVIREFTNGRVNYDYEHVIEFDYHKCVDKAGENSTKEEWKGIHELFPGARQLVRRSFTQATFRTGSGSSRRGSSRS
jgi:hypothetical protein